MVLEVIGTGKRYHVEFLASPKGRITMQTLKVLSQGHAIWKIINPLKSCSQHAMGPGIDRPWDTK